MMYSTQRSMDWPQLISAYYAGEESAFEAIFHYWFPRFASHARLGGIPDADAQDVALEALFKVARTREQGSRYDPSKGVAFSTWIYTIAHRVRLDFGRRTRRCLEVVVEDDAEHATPSPLDRFAGHLEDPFQVASRHGLDKALEDCLGRFDVAHREAFVLYKLEGFTLKEIVAAVGGGLTSTHRRVEAAQTGLRDCLGSKGYGQEATA
jgi:RNA polymerase sigma factor (sigma-70 family)